MNYLSLFEEIPEGFRIAMARIIFPLECGMISSMEARS